MATAQRTDAPAASVVVPTYDEGEPLARFLAQAARSLAAPAAGLPATELVVVDDGSRRALREAHRAAALEAEASLRAAGAPHRVRFVARERNGGKGAAIRRGWAEADPGAAWLGFVDADGSVSAPELVRLLSLAGGGAEVDVIAGSRVKLAGRAITRSAPRHYQGRVFATLAELLLHLGFYDTQCGAKLFRASLLRPRLGALREDRWLLDVEVLAALKAQGARCVEVPIDWADLGRSHLVPGLDAARMLLGLWRIRRRMAGHGAP